MRADSNLFDRKTCKRFEGHYLSVARCITAMKREMETQNSGRLRAICIAADDCLFAVALERAAISILWISFS